MKKSVMILLQRLSPRAGREATGANRDLIPLALAGATRESCPPPQPDLLYNVQEGETERERERALWQECVWRGGHEVREPGASQNGGREQAGQHRTKEEPRFYVRELGRDRGGVREEMRGRSGLLHLAVSTAVVQCRKVAFC
jgi:hypothetical protein